MDKPHFVYRHFDGEGHLLYVGMSVCPLVRTLSHSATAPWFAEVASITMEKFASLTVARVAERAAIVSENPLHNRRLRPRVGPQREVPYSHSINIRLPRALYAKLAAISKAEQRSMSNLMAVAGRELVERYQGARRVRDGLGGGPERS